MIRVTPALALLAVVLLGGCGGTAAPAAPPPPTSVREADLCSFVAPSVVTENGLTATPLHKFDSGASCSWGGPKFSMMVLVRWDRDVLVDLTQAFPVPGEEFDLDGVKAVVTTSDVRPACAAVVFPERGTVLEVVAGDTPPSTVASACARVKSIGSGVVHKARELGLLKLDGSATPTTSR
ncbi:DUF3558 family protein [Kutzneria sp. NPDC052558]|uniref:DUF3558 family protein n=1 Tax=Kutzneria sp. NPDC052558 TaxID=3364121 RepID=UPI0037C8EDA7